MDTLLVAIASIGGITLLAIGLTGLAALGRKLRSAEPVMPAIDAAPEVANAA